MAELMEGSRCVLRTVICFKFAGDSMLFEEDLR